MRFQNPEKVGYLQRMCNRYGDFKICTRRPDGTWTKHYSVLYCWEKLDTEGWRLDQANNRTSFPNELILDLDLQKGETKKQLKNRAKKICEELDKESTKYKIYFSGSKGYHIHLIIPNLEKYPLKLRTYFALQLGADTQLISKKHMIALENCPHWKTGKQKEEVTL